MTASGKTLGDVFDAHTTAEFQTRDIETTMATMAAKPHVTHVPTMTGGHGHDAVRRFYDTWFIGHWPEDLVVSQVSRTAGETQVAITVRCVSPGPWPTSTARAASPASISPRP